MPAKREKKSTDVSGLDDRQLKDLLEEAYHYKLPKDREGKSQIFQELLKEAEAESESGEENPPLVGVHEPVRGSRRRRKDVGSSSSSDNCAHPSSSSSVHQHHHSLGSVVVSASQTRGGSLQNLSSEDLTSSSSQSFVPSVSGGTSSCRRKKRREGGSLDGGKTGLPLDFGSGGVRPRGSLSDSPSSANSLSNSNNHGNTVIDLEGCGELVGGGGGGGLHYYRLYPARNAEKEENSVLVLSPRASSSLLLTSERGGCENSTQLRRKEKDDEETATELQVLSSGAASRERIGESTPLLLRASAAGAEEERNFRFVSAAKGDYGSGGSRGSSSNFRNGLKGGDREFVATQADVGIKFPLHVSGAHKLGSGSFQDAISHSNGLDDLALSFPAGSALLGREESQKLDSGFLTLLLSMMHKEKRSNLGTRGHYPKLDCYDNSDDRGKHKRRDKDESTTCEIKMDENGNPCVSPPNGNKSKKRKPKTNNEKNVILSENVAGYIGDSDLNVILKYLDEENPSKQQKTSSGGVERSGGRKSGLLKKDKERSKSKEKSDEEDEETGSSSQRKVPSGSAAEWEGVVNHCKDSANGGGGIRHQKGKHVKLKKASSLEEISPRKPPLSQECTLDLDGNASGHHKQCCSLDHPHQKHQASSVPSSVDLDVSELGHVDSNHQDDLDEDQNLDELVLEAAEGAVSAEATQLTAEETDFHVVAKRTRRKKRDDPRVRHHHHHHHHRYESSHHNGMKKSFTFTGPEEVEVDGGDRHTVMLLDGLPAIGRQRKSTSSVPPSDHSESSDVDSVHSLPVSSSTPKLTIDKTSTSSGSTPQTSYADIAKMASASGQKTVGLVKQVSPGTGVVLANSVAITSVATTPTVVASVSVTTATMTNGPKLLALLDEVSPIHSSPPVTTVTKKPSERISVANLPIAGNKTVSVSSQTVTELRKKDATTSTSLDHNRNGAVGVRVSDQIDSSAVSSESAISSPTSPKEVNILEDYYPSLAESFQEKGTASKSPVANSASKSDNTSDNSVPTTTPQVTESGTQVEEASLRKAPLTVTTAISSASECNVTTTTITTTTVTTNTSQVLPSACIVTSIETQALPSVDLLAAPFPSESIPTETQLASPPKTNPIPKPNPNPPNPKAKRSNSRGTFSVPPVVIMDQPTPEAHHLGEFTFGFEVNQQLVDMWEERTPKRVEGGGDVDEGNGEEVRRCRSEETKMASEVRELGDGELEEEEEVGECVAEKSSNVNTTAVKDFAAMFQVAPEMDIKAFNYERIVDFIGQAWDNVMKEVAHNADKTPTSMKVCYYNGN